MSKFIVEDVTSNVNNRVVFALPNSIRSSVIFDDSASPVKNTNNRPSVVGWMTNRLAFSGQATFGNPLKDLKEGTGLGQLITKAGKGLEFVSQARSVINSARDSNKDSGFLTTKNSIEEISIWQGSDRPIFNVNMFIIAVRPEHDVRVDVKKMLATVYPDFDSFSFGSFIKPPMGYRASVDKKNRLTLKNSISVQIGRWFKATEQVITSVNHEFSNEVTSAGTPLFVEVSISFMPFRAISASEAANYISG